jgi:hypothetical protein
VLIWDIIGFVFVEANVKKWGLAPVQGTLAPPPAYGYEAGSLLLERGRAGETSHLLQQQQQENQSYSTQILNHYGSTAIATNNINTHNNIPSIIEPIPSTSSISTSSSDSDDNDNTPLIQQIQRLSVTNSHMSIPIPSNSHRRENGNGVPTYSPPSYSTFPRLSTLMSRSNSSQEELERNRRAGLI